MRRSKSTCSKADMQHSSFRQDILQDSCQASTADRSKRASVEGPLGARATRSQVRTLWRLGRQEAPGYQSRGRLGRQEAVLGVPRSFGPEAVLGARRPVQRPSWARGRLGRQEARPETVLDARRLIQRPSRAPGDPSRGPAGLQEAPDQEALGGRFS